MDGSNDGNSLENCVENVRGVIELSNLMSHGLRDFIKPYKTGAGSSVKDENETFR